MFLSPYKTTACSRYKLDATYNGIRSCEINEELIIDKSLTGTLSDMVTLVPPGVSSFPPYLQPILNIDFPSMKSKVVLDARSMLRQADHTPLKVDHYRMLINYASTAYMWSTDISADGRGFRNKLYSIADYPCRVFAAWTASELGRRLGLDIVPTAIVRNIMAVHFVQMFHRTLEAKPDDKEIQIRIASKAARNVAGSYPPTVVEMLGGSIPYLNDMNDTVALIKKVLDNPRTDELTVQFMYSIMTYSLFPTIREMGAVALEYPPAFMALLYSAMTDRSINKTTIGVAATNAKYRGNDESFLKGYKLILSGRGYDL